MAKKTGKKGKFHSRSVDEEEEIDEEEETEESERDTWWNSKYNLLKIFNTNFLLLHLKSVILNKYLVFLGILQYN